MDKRFSDPADLDPSDWTSVRADAHRLLDDALDLVAHVRSQPVWRRMPDDLRQTLADEPIPLAGAALSQIRAELKLRILPYSSGNTHPGFMGWVQGGGNVFGLLGEMVASALNANAGGRDHAAIQIERQVVRWAAELFGLPPGAGGLFFTGSSIANFVAVLAARTAALGPTARREGVSGLGGALVAYTSAAAHRCVPRAMDMAGLGTDALRLVPVDESHRIDVRALAAAIAKDRAAGKRPFLIVGTAGTVDTGAIDELAALGRIARTEGAWFHVDGAFGALGMLAPTLRPLLAGIEEADSVAFDFHKLAQVPYDAGCLVVRDRATLLRTFSSEDAYLRPQPRGIAADAPWPSDMGPDLSRSFRALKVWLTLKALGAERIGAAIDRACAVARHLASRVDREPRLERVAPVALNVVCFRVRFEDDADRRNAALVQDLQEAGAYAPSTTTIDGHVVIRCAIVNHRTRTRDVDAFVDALLAAAAVAPPAAPERR